MRFATLIFTLFFSLLISVHSRNSEESAFAGTHFIIGFMENEVEVMHGGRTYKALLTAQDTTRIEIYKKNILQNSFIAVPDTAYEYLVGQNYDFSESEQIGDNLVEFKSDKPIVCYAFSSQVKSTDSYIAHPVEKWGKEYVITSMGIDHYTRDNTIPDSVQEFRLKKRQGEFLIIASEDSTNVYINPSEPTEKDWSGRDSQVLLDKGEGYLVKAFPMDHGYNDLTGSYIKSDKPVGVLTGHVRSAVPLKLFRDKDSKDHLIEMIYSVDRWSQNYISVPFEIDTAHTGDMFKITSAFDSTIVNMHWDGKVDQFTLNGIGDFKTIDGIDKPVRWTSNKPIQIAQFMSHTKDFDNYFPFFDPSMLILPSQDRMVKKLFYALPEYIGEYFRYTEEIQYIAHKIGIIMTQQAVQDISINGQLISTINGVSILPIEGTPFYYTNIEIQHGANKLETENGYFAAWSYGYGPADSYAMTLGSSLHSFTSNDSLDPEIDVSVDCGYIEGSITDYVGLNEGGLGSLIPIQDETNNYIFEITNQNTHRIDFEARPEKLLEDAQIVLDYRDLAGNGGVFRHSYKGLNIDFHGDLGIPDTEIGESSFAFYRLKNNSDTIRTLYSVTFFNDNRLSYELENGQKLPYEMQPGEELLVKVIFYPKDNPERLEDSIFIRIDCNYINRSRVRANVLVPKLDARSLDFDKVLVFTKKQADLMVINSGATDIVLESMDYVEYDPAFEVDTLNIFPYTLLIDDTLKLRARFSPSEKRNYLASVYFENNKNISNSANLRGIGAAPIIPDLTVDWGRRRVGSQNDTTVYLHNIGNWDADVIYQSTVSNSHDDTNLNTLEQFSGTLPEMDSIALSFSYQPSGADRYHIESENSISQLEDSLFNIRLIGEPSIPVINVNEIDLGNVFIDETIEGTYDAITTDGNEKLHIKSINPIVSLNPEFETDIADVSGNYYQPGTTIQTNIKFSPSELGMRQQYFLVENDAMPNYQYRFDTLKIYANVIPRDTITPVIEIQNTEGEMCRTQEITVSIANRGNIDFDITSLSYEYKENPYFFEPEEFELPVTVEVDKAEEFEIRNIAKDFENNELTLTVLVNDTILIEKTVELHYEKLESKITQKIPMEAQIGSNDTIRISGVLPSTDIDKIEMGIEIEFDNDLLEYTKQDIDLVIGSDGNYDTLKSNIIVLQNRLFLKEPIEITSDKSDKMWHVDLPFKILYKNEKSGVVNFEAEFNACYLNIVEKIAVKVLPICIFDLLPIEINDKLPSVSINSRIVRSEVELRVFIPDEDYVLIDIYDVTGAHISTESDDMFYKGMHQLKLDVDKLPVGTYLLNVQYQQYNRKILFIKSI